MEQPKDKSQKEWTFHKANLGEHSAQMLVYDFSGDGKADVLSTSAHRYGVWWHEQLAEGWKTHLIDKSVSQTHAVVAADINLPGAQETAALVKQDGGEAMAVQVDVSSAASVDALVKTALTSYGSRVVGRLRELGYVGRAGDVELRLAQVAARM